MFKPLMATIAIICAVSLSGCAGGDGTIKDGKADPKPTTSPSATPTTPADKGPVGERVTVAQLSGAMFQLQVDEMFNTDPKNADCVKEVKAGKDLSEACKTAVANKDKIKPSKDEQTFFGCFADGLFKSSLTNDQLAKVVSNPHVVETDEALRTWGSSAEATKIVTTCNTATTPK